MSVFIQRYSAWTDAENMPKLAFVPMLFRRRLSDLSKMVAYVVHDISDGYAPVPMIFASEFGEIQRQFKISSGILSSGEISPAMFSLSVFNAPVAAASIIEKNTTGYSAVFAGKRSFEDGLREASAPLLSGRETERIFVFADESIPSAYSKISPYPNPVCALAMRLSTEPAEAICELDLSPLPETDTAAEQALYFLEHYL